MRLSFCRILCALGLLSAAVSAHAQFTLDLVPVSAGAANLTFKLESDFYYSLEKSDSLSSGFTSASGWMLGDGTLVTWPVHYPTAPASSSGGSAVLATGDTFSVYPFANGKTLVTWDGSGGTLPRALIAQDYSTLPPLLTLHGSQTTPYLTLLLGNLAWDPAYNTLSPALLTAAQQATLARLTSRYADVIAATTASGSGGPGVVIESPKHFFRLRRVEIDGDHDGLSYAQEVFVYGSDPSRWRRPHGWVGGRMGAQPKPFRQPLHLAGRLRSDGKATLRAARTAFRLWLACVGGKKATACVPFRRWRRGACHHFGGLGG